MRLCRTCKIEKEETEFNIIRSTYRGPNGDISYEHYRLDCRDCHARKKYEKMLLRTYGLSLKEYNELIIQQNNQCAICKIIFETTPYVDHCHSTGRVRGLLCSKCNFGIGQFNDDINLLLQAIEYLKA